MEAERIQGAEIIVGDEPDFYAEAWGALDVSPMLRTELEKLDRRVNTVMVLSEMLAAHVKGKTDQESNCGIRYAWLTDRQAWAICDALKDMAFECSVGMEEIREKGFQAGVRP
ncbi:hypothetical protein [Lysobacter tyrosinilyticus]